MIVSSRPAGRQEISGAKSHPAHKFLDNQHIEGYFLLNGISQIALTKNGTVLVTKIIRAKTGRPVELIPPGYRLLPVGQGCSIGPSI
jgi:hypothetical protein